MAATAATHGCYIPSISKFRIGSSQKKKSPPPFYITTDPRHVNPHHLRDLFALCNHSSHRFPNLDSHGRVEPVDLGKLSTALSHSSVIVSVFTRSEMASSSSLSRSNGIGGEWLRTVVMPVTPDNGRLVGFGRAVSDLGLTASIYDVMVIPSLRGRGIGRMIVQRILRMLTNRGVYDISALCSDKERLFFRACGFGDDILGSTTMMYTRGLRRSPSLWKVQWYAVGWIDPNNKYCTKIDASGNANPVWKTKFSTLVDPSEANFHDLALNVEVYSRDPIFLRERSQGTATIILKEFLEKYLQKSEVPKPVEEVGSFQLRKKNSNKPQGFVDLSIRISEEREEPSSYRGDHGGIKLMDDGNGINLDNEDGPQRTHMPQLPSTLTQQPGSHPQATGHYSHPVPLPRNNYNPPANGPNYASASGPSYGLGGGTSYQPPRTPPPPPPPSNVGYIPTFLPRTDNMPPSYMNMPSSGSAPRHGSRPGFGMGLGAGALAAGAVIFGDDFMSGFDIPHGLQDASLTIATDPPL